MVRRYTVECRGQWGGLQAVEPLEAHVRTHAEALSGYYNEPNNRALLANDTTFAPPDVVSYYAAMRERGTRAFLLLQGQRCVGDCDLRNARGQEAEFAILVGPRDLQGKGLGTVFGCMVHTLAFGALGLTRVYASVHPDNRGSLRMFAKLGYRVDASREARRYADEPNDLCLSVTADAFRNACGKMQGDSLANLQILTT